MNETEKAEGTVAFINRSNTGHHFSRISQKVHPGWSRVYARVLREGTVSVGDAVRLLSANRQ